MSEGMSVNPSDTTGMYDAPDQTPEKKDDEHEKRHICTNCGSVDSFVYDHYAKEATCTGCGMIDDVLSEQMISRGREWRSFSTEENDKRSRVGPGEMLSNTARGSTFNERDTELTFEQRDKYRRLKKYNNRSRIRTSVDRNLMHSMVELDRLASTLGLPPHCKEGAALIYRKVLKKDMVRGRSINGMVAAAAYASIRMNNIVRSLEEVVTASPLEKKEISRCYRLMLRELDIKMPVRDAREFVEKIAEKAGVSQDMQKLATSILAEGYGKRILDGKDPRGLAASALYIACSRAGDRATTQGLLAKASGVTEVTLRNRYKGLEKDFEESGMSIEQIIQAYNLGSA